MFVNRLLYSLHIEAHQHLKVVVWRMIISSLLLMVGYALPLWGLRNAVEFDLDVPGSSRMFEFPRSLFMWISLMFWEAPKCLLRVFKLMSSFAINTPSHGVSLLSRCLLLQLIAQITMQWESFCLAALLSIWSSLKLKTSTISLETDLPTFHNLFEATGAAGFFIVAVLGRQSFWRWRDHLIWNLLF